MLYEYHHYIPKHKYIVVTGPYVEGWPGRQARASPTFGGNWVKNVVVPPQFGGNWLKTTVVPPQLLELYELKITTYGLGYYLLEKTTIYLIR